MKTQEGDLVLICNNTRPLMFVVVHKFVANQRDGWWDVEFLSVTMPVNQFIWTLREPQIDGEEFSINGEKMNIIPFYDLINGKDNPKNKSKEQIKTNGKVINLMDWKRKKGLLNNKPIDNIPA